MAGEAGLSRKITSSLVQRPGVALAGFMENFHPDRIQVIGRTEIDYLFSLPEEQQKPALARMLSLGVPAVMVATQEQVEFPPLWKELFELAGIPVFFCQGKSREVIQALSEFLEEHLSEKTSLHGVLLEILELGVLVMGRSGIGKSESALDLVNRLPAILTALSDAGIHPGEVRLRANSLEDVFIQLLDKKASVG